MLKWPIMLAFSTPYFTPASTKPIIPTTYLHHQPEKLQQMLSNCILFYVVLFLTLSLTFIQKPSKFYHKTTAAKNTFIMKKKTFLHYCKYIHPHQYTLQHKHYIPRLSWHFTHLFNLWTTYYFFVYLTFILHWLILLSHIHLLILKESKYHHKTPNTRPRGQILQPCLLERLAISLQQ